MIGRALKVFKALARPGDYPLEKPSVLQLPIIDICNSRCQMCRIWENKDEGSISASQLRNCLKSSLFSEVVSVGLNGGEPTLRKDLAEIAEVVMEELPKLKSLSLITNGFKNSEVIDRISEIGEKKSRFGCSFDVMISLDGFGDLHDRVRGKPGNFTRAEKVLDFALSSPLVDTCRVGYTIVKENVDGLDEMLDYCIRKPVYIKYRLGIPHQRLYSDNLLDPYILTIQEKHHVAEFLEGLCKDYEQSRLQKYFYRSLARQLTEGRPRVAGCDWKHRGATITSKGELLYCAVKSDPICDVADENIEQSYFASEGHLRKIVSNSCSSCMHDYMGIPDRAEYAKWIASDLAQILGINSIARSAFSRSGIEILVRKYRYGKLQRKWGKQKHQQFESGAAMHPGKLQVLVCGWYGTETLGDKAILAGIVTILNEFFEDLDIYLASLNPHISEVTKIQMPELSGIRILDVSSAVQTASSMDAVLFGGGPLMSSIDELASMEAIFRNARRGGALRVIAGCGVGPLGVSYHNRTIANILSDASHRIYRDIESKNRARNLGIDVASDIVTEDPSFTWLGTLPNTRHEHLNSKEIILGLALREFPYQQYAKDISDSECLAMKENYETTIISAIDILSERYPRLTVKPIPMCTNHFGGDDRWFYRRLLGQETDLRFQLDGDLLGVERAPVEYAEGFRECDVVLAMRFHSIVFCLGLGVPCVPIDYTLGDGKVTAIAGAHGLDSLNLASLSPDQVVSSVSRLIDSQWVPPISEDVKFRDALRMSLSSLGRSADKRQAICLY